MGCSWKAAEETDAPVLGGQREGLLLRGARGCGHDDDGRAGALRFLRTLSRRLSFLLSIRTSAPKPWANSKRRGWISARSLARAADPGQVGVHASDGARAKNHDRVLRAHVEQFLAIDDAGQRFREGGLLEREVIGESHSHNRP